MEGGVVPKSLYKLDLESASNEHEHSLYHSISLAHGQVHHIAININDPGAVLTWDFDVMRHNVIFTVLHETKAIQGDASTSATINTTTDDDSLATREWKEGTDCIKVEPSVICHDGESIQGTHIIQEQGTYILQWQNPDEGEFLPSISAHKAQLMYFYEVLPSAHYRGSMMSLQSAVSGRSMASSSLSR